VHTVFISGRCVLDERKCHVSRMVIRGSSMGVRIFAVGVLVTGVGVGLTAGYLTKTGDTLTVRESAAAQELKGQETLELPPPNTNNPQPLPAGARSTQVREEIAAEAKAKAIAKAKAEAAAREAKVRADQAAKARASRSKSREASGPKGEGPPPVPVDCKTLSGTRQIGCSLMVSFGHFPSNQFTCLEKLWTRESHWNPRAHNGDPNDWSRAHGIPQAKPGGKMSEYGADWKTNPVPQIKWGLNYIKDRYGTPCGAWGHSEATGWY
jgi:Tfp pilus assembly protein PilX